MSSSGGLSREEFLILQQQLIALRNRNYELQEALQKKNQEISQLSSPRSEALQFANKLINRRDGSKEKEIAQKYEAELDALRMKLTSQEEEFRLQQETLIAELNKIVSQNEALNSELEHFKADGSIYSSPQAGTPCEPQPSIVENSEYASVGSREVLTEASTSSRSSVGIQCDGSETPLSDAGKDASPCELIYESKSCQADEGVNVPDLENQLLEYKEMVAELRSSLENLSSKNAKTLSDVQEREDKIVSLMEELKVANDNIAKKKDFISHAIRSISKVTDCIGHERVPLPEQCTDEHLLEKEIHLILNFISENQTAIAKVTDEKTAVEKQLSEAQAKVDASAARVAQMEEAHKAERARADDDIHSLSAKLLELQKAHDSKVEAMERESANNCDEVCLSYCSSELS
ncbi:unnamed protein product [Haemonchus placei]|uniref:Cytospin-A n=1 Tax=Haemonchus placei TaxID=6290 RepID=A0A0N4WA27_HAEPC|nr:unnamed protein product [Haemonchus placei]